MQTLAALENLPIDKAYYIFLPWRNLAIYGINKYIDRDGHLRACRLPEIDFCCTLLKNEGETFSINS